MHRLGNNNHKLKIDKLNIKINLILINSNQIIDKISIQIKQSLIKNHPKINKVQIMKFHLFLILYKKLKRNKMRSKRKENKKNSKI